MRPAASGVMNTGCCAEQFIIFNFTCMFWGCGRKSKVNSQAEQATLNRKDPDRQTARPEI